jgi:hypothetical protein
MHPLEQKLREAGIPCRVEGRDRLAILTLDTADSMLGRELRLRAVQLAREEGFSHASIELGLRGAAFPRP